MKSEVNKKIVIWGHPLHSHTHSYIHYGFYRACKSIGYDVEWLDDKSENVDLSDSIVITSNGVIQNLPFVDSSTYFIHNLTDDFEKPERDNVHNFFVYHTGYSKPMSKLEKIDDYSWYDPQTRTPVIMWATDLLPEEIKEPVLYNESLTSNNFVGTIQGNNLITFAKIGAKRGKDFNNYGGYTGFPDNDGNEFYSNENNIRAIQDSYLSFDIREDFHLKNGYIPCRVFKNISYGKWTGTNATNAENFFGDKITVGSELETLYDNLEADSRNATYEKVQDAMNFVRDNHTYINRINSLFSIL
jgi:hypothetical protein